MAKFLNKKERVIDLELTSYGKYLFSIGKFKPVYYAFYDDNILYDGAYANITESQNNAHQRIKHDTPYLEGMVLFEDVGSKLQLVPKIDKKGTGVISVDTTPLGPIEPRFDNFRYDNAIGDSLLDGKDTSLAPSWKVVTLKGEISSSAQKETLTSITPLNIPQININLKYKKVIKNMLDSPVPQANPEFSSDPDRFMVDGNNSTPNFIDNKIITLETDHAMVYIDEVNTEILNENFDIEVFLIKQGDKETTDGLPLAPLTGSLTRKFFENEKQQIIDGFMVSENPEGNFNTEQMTNDAVQYYFDIVKDQNVDQRLACKSIETYNKQTYYVNLDFNCDFLDEENFYNDIYGSEVVPEICLD